MLLEGKLVYVPAQPEIDADLSEYGFIGNKLRAAYGAAAVEAGAPDKDVPQTEVVDAIANVLHYAEQEGLDIDYVLQWAREHYDEEREEAA